MSEWWTYELSDLILFSAHTYYRLIELYNSEIWPLQIPAILAGFAILYLSWRQPPSSNKIISILLAVSWFWVAWAFHWQRLATIHWVASYFAIAFIVQGTILAWAGLAKTSLTFNKYKDRQFYVGFALLGYAILIQPLIMTIAGHNWRQGEIFGIAPDPTVVATIGLLYITDTRKYWWLMIIPVLYCIVSAATLWVLKSANAAGMIIAGLLALLSLIRPCFKNKIQPFTPE